MTATRSDIAVAVYDLRAGAEDAVWALQCAGFNMKRISVVGNARTFGELSKFCRESASLGQVLTAIGIPGEAVRRYEIVLKADKFVLLIRGDLKDVTRARELLATSGHERFDHHHVHAEASAQVFAEAQPSGAAHSPSATPR